MTMGPVGLGTRKHCAGEASRNLSVSPSSHGSQSRERVNYDHETAGEDQE
jgi:hypothetical protein